MSVIERLCKRFNDCKLSKQYGKHTFHDEDGVEFLVIHDNCIEFIKKTESMSGTFIMNNVIEVLNELNVKDFQLLDNSKIRINNVTINLSKFLILSNNESYYSKFGFKSKDFSLENERLRDMTIECLVNKINDENYFQNNLTKNMNITYSYHNFDIIMNDGKIDDKYIDMINKHFNMNMKVKDICKEIKEYFKEIEDEYDEKFNDFMYILNICMFYVKHDVFMRMDYE